MHTLLQILFRDVPRPLELPVGFEARVFAALTEIQKQEMRRALFFSRVGIALFGGGSVAALGVGGIFFAGSEFAHLIMLLVSDGTLLLGESGRELLWLALETFPALSGALILTPVFVFLLLLTRHVSMIHRPRFSTPSHFSLA